MSLLLPSLILVSILESYIYCTYTLKCYYVCKLTMWNKIHPFSGKTSTTVYFNKLICISVSLCTGHHQLKTLLSYLLMQIKLIPICQIVEVNRIVKCRE